jgi:phosphoglycerate dehydrogenase-like enzyme
MGSVFAMLPAAPRFELPGGPPAGVVVLRWDGRGALPEGVERVRFWSPMLLASGEALDRAFAAMPDLRVVQLLSAGADAFVGRVPPQVTLCDARGVHGSSTSEWVLAGLLAAVRQLPRFVLAQARGEWDYTPTGELAGRRVLVVGAGDVGEQTAGRLAPFGVELTMVARNARPGVHPVEALPDLLPAHDVVVLVVPLTAQTRKLVDKAFLARMPDGAILVNASRGPVVDTDALTAELATGRLSAVLDVTDPEPLPPGHPLWTVPPANLLLTPHVAGSVSGFPRRAMRLVRDQLDRFLAGRPLHNVVTGDY